MLGETKMEAQQTKESLFGEPIYTYTSNQAIEDGILMDNPKATNFSECNLITTNLFEAIHKIETTRNLKRVFPYNPLELIGALMAGASEKYNNKDFEGDNDKNFFVMPKTEEGLIVWFVLNEHGKLTAMLPQDY